MEFNPDPNHPSDIPQDARLAAQMRKLTITPVHDDIKPDIISDAEVANQHIMSGAIPNSPYESEVTVATHTEQATANKVHKTALAYSMAIVSLLVVATSIAFINR